MFYKKNSITVAVLAQATHSCITTLASPLLHHHSCITTLASPLLHHHSCITTLTSMMFGRDSTSKTRFGPVHFGEQCALPGCGKESYDGKRGHYCTREHRDLGNLLRDATSEATTGASACTKIIVNKCKRNGCFKPSHNGKSNQFCSLGCYEADKRKHAECARHGCSKPSWNGEDGEFCSRKCRDGFTTRTSTSSTPTLYPCMTVRCTNDLPPGVKRGFCVSCTRFAR